MSTDSFLQRYPQVIYDDNHLIAVKKPSGWLVQKDTTQDKCLNDWVMEFIRKKYTKKGNIFCHPCHRIDRPVGGVVLFSKTSKSLERMNKKFADGDITKSYLAIVKERPEKMHGTLEHWLEKDKNKNFMHVYAKKKNRAKKAYLEYWHLSSIGKTSLLKIKLNTGRSHQIRAQLASINCPIKGDTKYGYPKQNKDKSIALHAYSLVFEHPVRKNNMRILDLPEDWDTYNSLINELD